MRISKGARARAERAGVARCFVASMVHRENGVSTMRHTHEYAIPHEYPAVVLKDMLRFNERMRHT